MDYAQKSQWFFATNLVLVSCENSKVYGFIYEISLDALDNKNLDCLGTFILYEHKIIYTYLSKFDSEHNPSNSIPCEK